MPKGKKDKQVDEAHQPWNAVRFDRLSRPQVDAVQAARAALGYENVRWSAVELLAADEHGGYIELTLHYVGREAREAQESDPGSLYATRMVVREDGSVRIKELMGL